MAGLMSLSFISKLRRAEQSTDAEDAEDKHEDDLAAAQIAKENKPGGVSEAEEDTLKRERSRFAALNP